MKRFAVMLLTLCLALTACAGRTQAPASREAVTFTDDLGRTVTVESHRKVAYFDVADFDAYLRVLEIFTDITGRKDLYEENGLKVQTRLEAVLAKSRDRLSRKEAPRVLCIVASASSIRAKGSKSNVLGEMLRSLGCVNIADSEKTLLENLSMEYILQEDPDAIFLVQRGADTDGIRENIARELESSPLWGQLTAVKEGRVFFMDRMLYNFKPNHRWGEAYEKLEEILSHVA